MRIDFSFIVYLLIIKYWDMRHISFFLLSVFLLGSCWADTWSKEITIQDSVKVVLNQDTSDAMKKDKPVIENYNILDITDWKEVRGIRTSDTKWYGKAGFTSNVYSLAVVFENLPEPQNWDFYEGWVVQKEPFNFISTWRIEYKNGMQVNIFTSNKDYTNHDLYILTLEPDDGDPAPADHILEWVLEF